jgi:hypothetical protein
VRNHHGHHGSIHKARPHLPSSQRTTRHPLIPHRTVLTTAVVHHTRVSTVPPSIIRLRLLPIRVDTEAASQSVIFLVHNNTRRRAAMVFLVRDGNRVDGNSRSNLRRKVSVSTPHRMWRDSDVLVPLSVYTASTITTVTGTRRWPWRRWYGDHTFRCATGMFSVFGHVTGLTLSPSRYSGRRRFIGWRLDRRSFRASRRK